jgi:hypothetical protein
MNTTLKKRLSNWIGQFILSKPTAEEIRAAQNWVANSNEFTKRVFAGDYKGDPEKFEAASYAITKQKKALRIDKNGHGTRALMWGKFHRERILRKR